MIFAIYRIIMFYYKTKNIQIIQKKDLYTCLNSPYGEYWGLVGSLTSEKYFSKPCGLVRGMEQVTSLIQKHSFYTVFSIM